MPWGWECRTKLIKQNPAKPTVPRNGGEVLSPAPNVYEAPQIFCGKGYDKIKRAPAYTFGHITPVSFAKPAVLPYAPQIDVKGMNKKGGGKGYDKIKRAPAYTFGHITPVSFAKPAVLPYAPQIDVKGMNKKGGTCKITHGVVSPQLEPPGGFRKIPGPGAHTPVFSVQTKRPPAYTCRPAARKPYQSSDMWTPPPNMYCPPIPRKNPPAFSLTGLPKHEAPSTFPGPSQHDPNFNYVKITKPAFSFGYPFRPIRKSSDNSPAPNTYCEKKYMNTKKHIPAPSFGIRHTPYLGKQAMYEKPSNLDITLKSG